MSERRKGGSFGPRDYSGSEEGGGYPRTGAGAGGTALPQGWGGTRYGGEAEGARQVAWHMEDPSQVRARSRTPRSYRRSDERLREDICERLSSDSRIDPSDVSVQVREGRVVLEGTVPERRMKYVIEDIAAECLRANDVDNRISVSRASRSSDAEQGGASELGNFAGSSGTTGRPAGVSSPPAGDRDTATPRIVTEPPGP